MRGSGNTSLRSSVGSDPAPSPLKLNVVLPASSFCWSRCRWSQRVNSTRPKLSRIGVNEPEGECCSSVSSPLSASSRQSPVGVAVDSYSSCCG